ncbi:ABC transporter ATP-binding protein [Conexibacter stalactiti]|uniref:ABC transporter ATP-binding protein n=1 Tax=Conexibacter stalactiti TaxID=1940611 RepID=A0ABU4HUF9_9ACTN|nr:ABC transporter ATP-binding protein [Conexibacter stalactiti]MDW5596957.1 ABC transporter ATP-binding protein [Conexibacter stalactiti]MEC5037599.1 ABC transporter ATP-binding protein [Conexibacter stalactiti]
MRRSGGQQDGDERLLVATDVRKAFAGTVALAGVSLRLEPRSTVGLIGPNGSGKTTLINCVSGVVRPDAGSVRVGGVDLAQRPSHARAKAGVARTFQNIRLFRDLTVAQNCEVALVAQPRARRAETLPVAEVLELLGLADAARERSSALSYGAQRRAELARAAVTAPRFLLLDEPAAGMNERETEELIAAIRALRERLGCGVLVVEHDLGLIGALCDTVEVLDAGNCISRGTPQEVRADPAVIEAYIGGGGEPDRADRAGGTDRTPTPGQIEQTEEVSQ